MQSLTVLGEEIHMRKDNQTGVFSCLTGIKLRGDLDCDPKEVLFLAWRQRQSPKKSDAQLRAEFNNRG